MSGVDENVVTVEDADEEVTRSLANAAPSGELVCEPIDSSGKMPTLLNRNIKEKGVADLSGLHDEPNQESSFDASPPVHAAPQPPKQQEAPQFTLEDIMRALGVNAAQQRQYQPAEAQQKMPFVRREAPMPPMREMPAVPPAASTRSPFGAESGPFQIGVGPDGRPVFVRPISRSQPPATASDWQSQIAAELRRLQEQEALENHHEADAAESLTVKDSWIAIDLGAAVARVAIVEYDTVHVLTDDEGNRSSASCLVFDSQSPEIYIAEGAQHSMSQAFPQSTVFDFLSLLHKPITHPWVQANAPFWPFRVIADIHGECAVQLIYRGQWRVFSIEDLLALQLNSLRLEADRSLHRNGEQAKNVVLSSSCDLSICERESLVKAAHRAGFEKVRTAFSASAALSNVEWGVRHIHANAVDQQENTESLTLVVDCGADRTHIAFAKACEGLIETQLVRSQQWPISLTHAMMNEIAKELRANAGVDLLLPRNDEKEADRIRVLLALRQQCENAKHSLSVSAETVEGEEPSTTIELRDVEEHPILSARFTLSQFNEICAPFAEQTAAFVKKTADEYFASLNSSAKQVDEIVLMGGHSHLPAVQRALTELLSGFCASFSETLCLDVSDGVHRAEGVVCGCAAHAAVLAGKHDLDKLSLDALASIEVSNYALSLHVGDLHDPRRASETGVEEKLEIIPAGSHLPVRKTKLLALAPSSQSMRLISMSLYEEDKGVFRCMIKVPVDLSGSSETAERVLRVIVDVDSDYSVSIRVQDLSTQSVLFEKEKIIFSPLIAKVNTAVSAAPVVSQVESVPSKAAPAPKAENNSQEPQEEQAAFEQALRNAILREQQIEQQKRNSQEMPAFARSTARGTDRQVKPAAVSSAPGVDQQFDWWNQAAEQQPLYAGHHALTVPKPGTGTTWTPNADAPVFVPASRASPRGERSAVLPANRRSLSDEMKAAQVQQQQRQQQQAQLRGYSQQWQHPYQEQLQEELEQAEQEHAFQEFLRQLVTKRERDELEHEIAAVQQMRGRPRLVENISPLPTVINRPHLKVAKQSPQSQVQVQQKAKPAQADSLFVCLDSAFREFELSPQDVRDAWHTLKDEAIASPALLKRLSAKSLQELLHRKGVKIGVAVAVQALHDELCVSAPSSGAVQKHTTTQRVSQSSSDAPNNRVIHLEEKVAQLENKIDQLTNALLGKSQVWR